MRLVFLSVVVLVLNCSLVSVETSKTDSLLSVLSQTSSDTARFNLYTLLGKEFQKENPDSALFYFSKGAHMSTKYHDEPLWENLQSQAFRELGNTYNNLGETQKADSCFNRAIGLNRKLNNEVQLGANLTSIGINRYLSGDYEQSIKFLLEALAIFQKTGNRKAEAETLKRLGVLFLQVNNYAKAIEYATKGLRVYEQIGDKLGVSGCYSNLGIVHYEQSQLNNKRDEKNQLDSALFFHFKSFEINKELDIKSELARNYTNISNVYSLQGKVEESIEYSQQALKIYEELGNKRLLVIGYANMAGANITLADSTHEDSSKRNMYLNRALEYEQKAHALAKEQNMTFEIAGSAEYMRNIYKRLGQYDKAVEYAELSAQYKDSLLTQEKVKSIAEMSTKYETEQKEQQLKMQEAEMQNEKILRYFLIIGVIALGALAYYVFRNYKRKHRDNQLLSEQKEEIALQAEQLEITNQKLIELGTFKEGMTNMIVHDLKNPLNAILNLADNELVKLSANQMLNLVLNILDVSKFEHAKMAVDRNIFSIYQNAQKAISHLTFLIEAENIDIENRIENSCGVVGDAAIVERIFVNLLSNALKYTLVNGKIELISRIDEVNRLVVISVRDNGSGILPEYHEKVFEKFSQIEAKKSGSIHSTGLGLTFCKIATEAHGGKIWIDKDYFPGTSVSFTIPLASDLEESNDVQAVTSKQIVFTEQEKLAFLKYQARLKELEISEISALRQLFKEIESDSHANSEWLKQLKNAVNYGNKEQFDKLINLALEDSIVEKV